MKQLLKHSFAILAVSILIFSSCKVARPVTMPPVKNLPDSFPAAKDSSSIASIAWKQFFTDDHLVALIDTALHNNPDLYIALQRIEAARAQVAMSRGALLPSLNGVVSAAGDRYGDYTMNGVGNFDTNLSPNINSKQKIPTSFTPDLFVGFRSNWEIDIWGKLKNEKKAAIAQLLATEKGRQYITTSIVADIAMLYYDLLALDNELDIIKKNVLLQETALDIVKVQKEGGRATELAVQQFAAQLLNTKAIEYSVKQEIVQAENEINLICGRYPQTISRDTSLMHQQLPASLQTGLPSTLLTRRPDIQQAELELEAAEANVLAARKAFLPSLNLTPYIGLNAFKPNVLFNSGSVAYGAVAGLTAPIFNQNKLKAGYAIANAQNKEAIYNYQKVLLSSFSEVVTSLKSIENGSESFKLKEQEVRELTNAVATAKDLYLTGYANYLEVISAQKGVLEAELQLNGNKKQLFQSVIGLYRSLGGGWE
ncbi:TolC family protein [Foetidibacter luteolus]|uniref:TolC family protein n=1 Tax=Foetidibacter luteolus TaxID=2608880 RepID=UPI00129A7C48|nr:TolC family protein [Foetidibacter luteolus]